VHHVGILYGQFMMHGQRNIKPVYLVLLLVTLSRNVTFSNGQGNTVV